MPRRRSLSLLLPVLLLAGCNRPQIVTYVAPKDPPPPSREQAHSPDDGHDHGKESPSAPEQPPTVERPKVSYKAPADWVVGPAGSFSVATFQIKAAGGEATVAVTPMGSYQGREEAVINMWRQMAGAQPLPSDEAKNAFSPIEIAGEKAQLFEVSGSRDDKPTRIVTAMLHHPEGTWFFKLQGDDAAVAAQKPAFLDFLKTIRFGETAPAPPKDAAAPPEPKIVTPPPAVTANPPVTPKSEPEKAPPVVTPIATPAPILKPAPPTPTPATSNAPTQ
jgi:hypothetical protein